MEPLKLTKEQKDKLVEMCKVLFPEKGLLVVNIELDDFGGAHYVVNQECTPEQESQGLLQTIYEDGKFYNQTTLNQIRDRLKNI